jgi:pimeloyl-ACP methyl ester carboxylesterase
MTITFRSDRIGAAPLLLAHRRDLALPLPAVLWFHGFGVDKETHRKELSLLADERWLAVGVDNAGHGERRLADLDARIAAPREEAFATMLTLADETAREVPHIIDGLVARGLADPQRLAVAGISMGAFVVYRAVAAEPRIRAAVAILGSPEGVDADALARTALLSINAERDVNVPPAPARALHAALGGNTRYVELPGAEHLMDEESWATTMRELRAWLQTNL